jgi:hypothetical protein
VQPKMDVNAVCFRTEEFKVKTITEDERGTGWLVVLKSTANGPTLKIPVGSEAMIRALSVGDCYVGNFQPTERSIQKAVFNESVQKAVGVPAPSYRQSLLNPDYTKARW